ncbi:MAG: formylmethanofuran dehydrogenase subunit B [Methanocellales archaeon]|nr:formylmethanofuran dehydrogenase subunit B [Methanocellales archaeon]MDD3291461.1 formylmethanofuran dehydrogenase subunit B [Methanocellales archaeon]MDD5234649.1 formylmethanofuran dehydrogenase subunit B [Methanocellales archaeon]MDD5484998.1 formylmethanofuran dehydrogenase subunit B [Methanocellales archaeon]
MIITDVLCPFCGDLCDDIIVEVEGNKIIEVKEACETGVSKMMGHERIASPMIREDGKLRKTTYEEAIDKTAEILTNSLRPLMYGWGSTTCEADEKGIELAEELGAIIDNTTSVCHAPSILALQNVGLPSCTLGQIKNRADLIIYWGSNQAEAHPRHMSKYTSFPKGFFTQEGRKGKHVMVFDVRKTTTAEVADDFVQILPGEDYRVLSALRAILAGAVDVVPSSVGGVPKEKLVEIVNRMKNSKFGVLFFGMGLTQSKGKPYNVANAISLVRDLNAHTKFAVMPMRGHYNVTGITQVCTWLTGFAFAVDFARGRPWYNPGETSTVDVLNRGECDSALIVASDPAAHFPRKSVEHLAKIPLIQIDPYPNLTTELADVVLPAAIAGIEVEGTAYRMDGVPLRLRKLIEPTHLSDEEILSRILGKVREIRGD